MRRSLLLVVALAAVGSNPPRLDAQERRLTLEQTSSRGDGVSFASRPPNVRWADDGVHLVETRNGESVVFHPLTGEEVDLPNPDRHRREALEQAFRAIPGFSREDAERAARARVVTATTGDVELVNFENDLYAWMTGGTIRRLTDDAAEEVGAELSPDGRFVAFVRDSNLFLVGTDSEHPPRAVTRGGGPDLLFGQLDWVYEEEVFGRGNRKGLWWGPNSRHVAFLRLEEAQVPRFTIVNHIPYRLETEVTPYPKAGDANPTVGLGVARVRGGLPIWVDLSRYEGSEILIVRVGWNPAGSRIVFEVQDRIQTWLDLNLADPRTGKLTHLLRETSPTWVNVLGEPRWLDDGSFLWLSERSGFKHIYHYQACGTLIRAVTSGEWPVDRLLRVDEERRKIFFTASPGRPTESHAYSVNLDGTDLEPMTVTAGSHRVTLNHDATLYLDRFSSISEPTELRLCRADATIVRTWNAPAPALDEYCYRTPELLEIPARDDTVLDALLIRPPDFDERRSHAVWLSTYSGPDGPSVRNRWHSSPWDQFLAQQGFLVFRVNVRTASRRGQVVTGACYKSLGVQELRDLEDAVDWLCKHPWADAARVGITGWSYGGFMAAYALTHSNRFRLGIAGAGVYDWRCYDTIYTERYMSTPQLNPDGYEASSCTAAAADLQGHLVIIHGTMDDNVHLQNAMQFAYALQNEGKRFDLMLYPRSRHGIGRGQRWHQRQLEWRAIQEHLGSRM